MKRLIAIILTVALVLSFGSLAFAKAYTPSTNNQWDLGTTKLKYKDIIIGGDITSNSIKVIDSGVLVGGAIPTNTVSVTVPATDTQGTATVTSGSTLLGAPYGVANIHFLAINGITNASISGTTLLIITNGTTGSNAVVYKAVVLEP